MGIPTNSRSAFIDGLTQADRAHRELKLDSQSWVDPFAGILKTDALFMLRPLDGLYGAFVPGKGSHRGILVNSKHPLPLQRFTAAHELGHLWMGHGESFDTEKEILRSDGGSRVPMEIAAETFASFLLMPRAVVEQRITDLRFQNSLNDPRAAYVLSLWFGVSYLAMVWQLASLKWIKTLEAKQLAQVPPKKIKALLLDGDALEDPWADVLPLSNHSNAKTVVGRVGDELAITLPNHSPSGYLWDTSALVENGFELMVARDLDAETSGERVGHADPKRLVVRLAEKGQHDLRLVERRPFSKESPPSSEFNIHVIAVEKHPEGRVDRPLLPAEINA
jgi:predicted secreted protein